MRLTSHPVVFILIFALVAAPFLSSGALAEGTVEVNMLKVEGLVVGTKVKIDQEYNQKYKTTVNVPFEFIAPKLKGVKTFAAFPPDTGGEYIKLSFATEDKQLIENLRFVSLSVANGDKEKRVAALEELLMKKALPMAVKGYANPKFLGKRRADINGLDAVEVAAQFEDPKVGLMYVWLVGILDPNSDQGIMAMNQITQKSEVKQPADIGKIGIAVRALSTFKFITK